MAEEISRIETMPASPPKAAVQAGTVEKRNLGTFLLSEVNQVGIGVVGAAVFEGGKAIVNQIKGGPPDAGKGGNGGGKHAAPPS
jgi:hypothetical protein